MTSTRAKHLPALLWPIFLLGHWLAIGLLAWHLLAQVNFVYPTFYQWLGIESHIAEFAPQNRHRSHFHHTSPNDHYALFAGINQAIHSDPDQLARLAYIDNNGQHHLLLHGDEVLHLQDVARLVKGVYLLGLLAFGAAVLSGLLLWKLRFRFPSARRIAAGTLSAIALTVIGVWLLGPKRVFYMLHEWIFPPEHPWFFYYQDSLMTTLMKAPDLFGAIAIALLLVWLAFWGASLWIIVRLWLRRVGPIG